MKIRKLNDESKISEITLFLSEKEALWLKGTMQNPIEINDFESKENRKMREVFWDCLKEITF